AFISSPDNIKKLDKYREINTRLADPRRVKNDAELGDLIKNGKTIVSIACSIHSTEIVASQMSMNLAYELATATDADTKEILDNTILLLIPSHNPDGVNIVANWYRKTLGTKSEGTSPPELYHHYAGHDDNRDWFAFTQVETRLTVDSLYNVWHPQIVHDIHQMDANGARLFLPPYLDPVEPNVDPLLIDGVNALGTAMAWELSGQGKTGISINSTYDAWTPA